MSCYEAVASGKQTNLTRTLIDKQDMDEIDILNGLRQIDVSVTCVFFLLILSFPLDSIPLKMNIIIRHSQRDRVLLSSSQHE